MEVPWCPGPHPSPSLVGAIGWRWAWVALGLAVWAALLPIAACRVLDAARRPHPNGSMLLPRPVPALPPARHCGPAPIGVVLAAVGLNALVATGLTFHHVDVLAAGGLSATAAAANFLPQTVAGAAAALVAGRLADRVAERALLAGTLVTLAAAPLLVAQVSPGLVALAYGVVLGAAALAAVATSVRPPMERPAG